MDKPVNKPVNNEFEIAERTASRKGWINLTVVRLREEEEGSISVLIVGLFLLLLIISVSILDASDAYMAKRELLAIGERSLTKSVHNLSLPDYYSSQGSQAVGDPLISTGGIAANGGFSQSVPLNCPLAIAEFEHEISISDLRGSSIAIQSVNCENNRLTARIESTILPIVNFPILNSSIGDHIHIIASPAALSIFSTNP